MRKWMKSVALLITGALVGALLLGGFLYRLARHSGSPATYTLRDDILVHGNADLKEVALTFDDGPNNEATASVMSILAEYDARATFFVVGKQVEKNPALVRRMMNKGHEVGNHSFN